MTFYEWLSKICETEKPGQSIIAYNFGIFETEEGYTIYLTGSTEFDEEDSEWATNEDFTPQSKYFPLSEDFSQLNWENALKKIELMLKDFVNSETYNHSFFSKAKAITTGFDDGDLILIR
jgi:hypothetical protein